MSGLGMSIQDKPAAANVGSPPNVTASEDFTARIFNVFQTTQDLIDHARSIVPRQLTACERKRFFLPAEGEVGDCPN